MGYIKPFSLLVEVEWQKSLYVAVDRSHGTKEWVQLFGLPPTIQSNVAQDITRSSMLHVL